MSDLAGWIMLCCKLVEFEPNSLIWSNSTIVCSIISILGELSPTCLSAAVENSHDDLRMVEAQAEYAGCRGQA
ncbi:hypothetical protein VitviT2T_021305 [Vitis vinifera]|uniref:Uncharacterized protein n=1 Tax=Vitis vinifera TaxID=29760 RepID=A0ABY9D840_VITVI|nr:hypothetical protein VitviT2T_021305 [Vitis vinifera]